MAIRPVLRMGDSRLNLVAEPIKEFATPELQDILTDMFDTMEIENGIGIAAPQINISKRIMIFSVDTNPRYPYAEPIPTTVLINPEITILGPEMDEGWEACLSVPGMRGLVPRYLHLKYKGYDFHGNLIEREAHNFHAIVVQHEYDHLNGVLYPSRIKDLTKFGFEEELQETVRNYYLKRSLS